MIKNIIERDTFMYVETSFRKDSKVANNYSLKVNKELDKLLEKCKSEEIFEYTLPDNIVIKQYKVSKLKNLVK